jgi:hypothetical protein
MTPSPTLKPVYIAFWIGLKIKVVSTVENIGLLHVLYLQLAMNSSGLTVDPVKKYRVVQIPSKYSLLNLILSAIHI